MDSTNDPDKHEERAAFLSGPPRSGELTPFASKLAAESFVCLASIVVFGSTANFGANSSLQCTPLCQFGIATGVISFLISAIILLSQYLALANRVDKSGAFSSKAEQKAMGFLSIWWMIGVAFLSALEPSPFNKRVPVPHSSGVGIMFGWLALFGSIFATYKTYHTAKEEENSLRYAQVMSIRAAEDEEYANYN